MAFQGFAREEQFSTNQIKIDIGSRINADLAEAQRISKWYGRNAEFGEKYRGMYLDALMTKHREEKRNNQDNFNFFMENRRKIQEQIEYNNSVKAEDASRSHPYIPTFMEMLQPALMKMAVDVGATGIKKLFDDHAKHQAEVKAEEKQKNLNGASVGYHTSNVLQQKNIDSGALDGHKRNSAEEQKAVDHHYSLNPQGMSKPEIQQLIHYRNGLTDLQKEGVSHSPANVTRSFGQYATDFVMLDEESGIEVTLGAVQGGEVTREVSTRFWDELQNTYLEQEYGGLHKLHPVTGNTVLKTVFSEQDKMMHVEQNNRRQNATKDMQVQFYSEMENIGNRGGSFQDKVDYWFGDTGPSGFYGRAEAHNMFEDWLRNGGATSTQVSEYMRTPRAWAGGSAINDELKLNGGAGTERSRAIRDILYALRAEEYKRMTNDNVELLIKAEQYKRGIQNLTPQEADRDLRLFKQQRILNGIGKEKRTEIIDLLLQQSGKLKKPEGASPGSQAANDHFGATFFTSNLNDITGEYLAETDQPALPAKTNMEEAKNAMKGWVAEQLDDAYANGRIVEGDELAAQTYINNLFRDPNEKEAVKGLKEMLRVETQDPVTKKAYEAHEVKWKGLKHDPGVGEKTDGILAYTSMTSLARVEKRRLSRQEIMSNPVVKRVLKPWLDDYQEARDSGEDVQPIIRNAPALAQHMANHWKNGSLGQVLQAAIDHGGYEESYKRLADMEYQNAREVQDRSRELGILFSKQPQQVQNHINQFGVRPASHVRREGILQPGDHFKYGTQGIKTPQGVFANREIAGYATSIAKAYPNMTWTSTQRTPEYQEQMKKRGYSPADTSNHLKGISFDAVGPDAQRLRRDIDSGKVQGLDYYIGPGYTHVHFDILGPVSIDGQLVQQAASNILAREVAKQETTPQEFNQTREAVEELRQPEQSMSLGDVGLGVADFLTGNAFNLLPDKPVEKETPEIPEGVEIAGETKNGILFGKLNGQRVRIQPYGGGTYPISERTWNLLVEQSEGPVKPMSFLGGGN